MISNSDSLSEHPLFRALVLMGGGLALSCGGVARTETGATDSGGAASTGGGTSDGGSSAGNSSGLAGAIGLGGSLQVGDAGPPFEPECPYAQWDCSAAKPQCVRDVSPGLAAAGCVCDRTRPQSSEDCGANEALICQQGYLEDRTSQPETWDHTLHVQCSCISTAIPSTWEVASAECNKAFRAATYFEITSFLPDEKMCDAQGHCTATSSDILRQDGIMCGCAAVALK